MSGNEVQIPCNALAVTAGAGDGFQRNNRHRIDIYNNNNLWDKLPLDLQLQVLERVRLPLKELARLRPVCKLFHSFLSSNPSSATLYHPPPQTKFFLHSLFLDQCPSAPQPFKSLYFLHDETHGTSRWMPPLGCPQPLFLMASNDGFLCFADLPEPDIFTIFVHNPTAPNLWKILTVPNGGPVDLRQCLMGIAFDRELGACKIVLSEPISEKLTRTLIYDAKADTWRMIPDQYEVFVPRMQEPFVFDGHFHWLVWSQTQQSEMVVLFDVAKERWEEPVVLDGQIFRPLCMVELEKQACVISVNVENSQKLELWKLDIQGKRNHEWARTITAPFQLDINVSVFGGGDVFCIGSNRRFWVYHVEDKVWRHVGLFHKDIWKCRNAAMHRCAFYKPSLLRFQGDQLNEIDLNHAWLDL